MKKRVKLTTNLGNQDREKYGLTDYDLDDLKEGKEISIDEKTAVVFVANGWIAATGADKPATVPTGADAVDDAKDRAEAAKKRP